jgi:hypothetical protein
LEIRRINNDGIHGLHREYLRTGALREKLEVFVQRTRSKPC